MLLLIVRNEKAPHFGVLQTHNMRTNFRSLIGVTRTRDCAKTRTHAHTHTRLWQNHV